MKKNQLFIRKLVVIGTAIITLLGVAGCGVKASAKNVSDELKEEVVAEVKEEAPAKESTKEVKRVIVAVENGSKPLSFIDEDGNVAGYEVDVLKAVDELIPEYELQIEAVEADATQIGLETGKYALIGGGLYRTPEREEKYLLPDAIAGVSTIKIFIREDNTDIKTLDDLVGKKITPPSPNGGIYNLLTEYNEAHPDNPLTFETADGTTIADRFKEIDNGTYDALVIPDNLGYDEIIKELGLKVVAVQEPVKVNPTYFALAKEQTDLTEKVSVALATLRENGTLSDLSVQWFGEDKIAYYKD